MKRTLLARRMLNIIFIIIILILCSIAGFSIVNPLKQPKTGSIKKEYEGVLNDLKVIASEVHSSDTEEIGRVREYILDQIADLEYTPELETFTSTTPDGNEIELINILVHVDNPNANHGVLFVSHYDSTYGGPGAADDGISVASMLESMRYLVQKGNAENDFYFLFTDGEEQNLLGARQFVKSHSALKDSIKLTINLEARGNKGTLLMFETSKNSKNIVHMLQNSLEQFSGFAFTAELYRTMPNDTDLTEFLNEGWEGINFAVIDGGEAYHDVNDNYENIDRDTGFMYYKTCRDLIDTLTISDLSKLKSSEDAVYFPILKSTTLVFSSTFASVFQVVICIIAIVWIFYLFKKKVVRVKGVLLSIAFSLGTMIFCSLLATFAIYFENQGMVDIENFTMLVKLKENINMLLALCIILFAGVITYLLSRLFRNMHEQILGVLLLLIIGTIASMVLFPSIAYVFSLPLLACLIFSIAQHFIRHQSINYIGFTLVTFIVLVLIIPVIDLIFEALFIHEFMSQYGYYIAMMEGFFATIIMQAGSIL
ncbi:MAG TPA: M28 family peptidase, partial [Lachnospiraceae bacterium]|nr:M28 family peptidase [Lachnospiraceae bacterium]